MEPVGEYQYLNLLQNVLEHGHDRLDRTGVGTRAQFGGMLRFDLAEGFPIHTTKRVYWKTAFKEMLLFLQGETKLRAFLQQNVRIWTDWPLKVYRDQTGEDVSQSAFEERILADDAFAQKWGDLGPIYGKQWRRWQGPDGQEIDQVQQVIQQLKENPASRRILWEGWNVGELDQMALPPCHKHYQFFVANQKLSGACVVRSNDLFLGQPWNQISLALVTHLLAQQCGYEVGDIVYMMMDAHIYKNHFDQVQLQLSRQPKPLPTLVIKRQAKTLFDYTIDDFDLEGYDPHPAIAAEVAV